MSDDKGEAASTREAVLNPVDRVSEALFGLFMALTFVGAVSVTEGPEGQIRSMFAAALGCNLAWGLVDAVMYLIRTVTDRGRSPVAAGDRGGSRANCRAACASVEAEAERG